MRDGASLLKRTSHATRRGVLRGLGLAGVGILAGSAVGVRGAAAHLVTSVPTPAPESSPDSAPTILETWIAGHQAATHDPGLLAADAVLELPGVPPIAGPQAIVGFLDAFYGAIGARMVTPETLVVSGDTAAVLLAVRGTHDGTVLGVPPTGNPIDVWLAAFVDVRVGQIARIRAVLDALVLLTQFGALPVPGTPAPSST